MAFRLIIIFALIIPTSAIQCYNREDSRIKKADKNWKNEKNDHGICKSNKWCARVTGSGQRESGNSKQDVINGVIMTCVGDLGAKLLCDEIGNNCKQAHQSFLGITGDINICCCDSDLCNGVSKVAFSAGILIIMSLLYKFIT